MRENKGFTLIELLVVIAILGILGATVFVTIGGNPQQSARQNRAESELNDLTETANAARTLSGKTLRQITNDGCSDCTCRSNPGSNSCANAMESSWEKVFDAAEVSTSASGTVDPWGHPYMIDENEGEFAGSPCRQDKVSSVGPDGDYNTSDDLVNDLAFSISECR